jgi:hypothetical protein
MGPHITIQSALRPDYDSFFYRQLSRRARRIYLFRGEYIFDLEKAVVVETPQLGHATYVFAKPRSMEGFLGLYTRIAEANSDESWARIPSCSFAECLRFVVRTSKFVSLINLRSYISGTLW